MSILHSFPPVARPDARVLILGSMPGVRSLDEGRYYAHPQNAFWPLMAQLLGFPPDLSYTERLTQLTANHIALWDVFARCRRKGSLDSAINEGSIETNDITSFLKAHPHIQTVFFNGSKPEEAFQRYILPQIGALADRLKLQRLPSTSPAFAGMSREQKARHWQVVREACRP